LKKGQEVLSFQRENDDRGLEEKPRGADVTLHTLSWPRLGLKKKPRGTEVLGRKGKRCFNQQDVLTLGLEATTKV